MGILAKISVGDILYYEVDDIPTHIAPKGSVSIIGDSSPYDNTFMYVNNNGGSVWLKCIDSKYGQITLNNGTTVNTAVAPTVTPIPWNAFNPDDTWTLNPQSHPDFILSTQDTTTDDLLYTGDTTMRVIASQSSTIRGGTTRWIDFEVGVSHNFSVPTAWNEMRTDAGTVTTMIQSQNILEFITGDYVLGGRSIVDVEKADRKSVV